MTTTITPAQLPAVVRSHLTTRDADAAVHAFTDDAVVVDDGATHRGAEAVRSWLHRAASEYTFTTEVTGAERIDADHWLVVQHLEGDFPGGVVDLRYHFTLRGDRIAELTIAP
ncbi:nuclear transport factor 2 family protein [Modestobacter altitudinis]|uniref:nuclear transport factor 2 family protein n=1 Tax=Modestobacter altitudinis TaxID=2213158 RepID=UPI00110D0FFE|nr:nuclear transport factor 2 family protein [Modestobacter altitudinis]